MNKPLESKRTARKTFDKRVNGIKDAKDRKLVIGVVTSKHHRSLVRSGIVFPEEEEFAVMGAYVVVDYWIDILDGARTLIARLQKTDERDMWWTQPGTSFQSGNLPLTHDPCPECDRSRQVRYLGQPPYCGHPDCRTSQVPRKYSGKRESTKRGMIPSKKKDSSNDHQSDKVERQYSHTFLASRIPVAGIDWQGYASTPPAPVQLDVAILGQAFVQNPKGKHGWASYVCNNCCRFNQRTEWHHLKCRKCGNIRNIKLPDMTLEELIDPKFLRMNSYEELDALKLIKNSPACPPISINMSQYGLGDLYFGVRFNLFDDNFVMVLYPKRKAIGQKGGSKDLFKALWAAVQSGEVPLARRLMKNAPVPKMLTAHFVKNYGVEYITKVQGTEADENVPQIIMDIRDKLSDIVYQATDVRPNHNEALVLGMMPAQHIGWHSDGEKQIIGPIVSSMSFGGNAIMKFGLSKMYRNGGGRDGRGNAYELTPIIPGCLKHEEKSALHAQYTAGEINEEVYKEKLLKFVKTCNASDNPAMLIQFPLFGNGTIMLQFGPTLNKFYAHTVNATDKARIVVTGRQLEKPKDQSEEDKSEEEKSEDGKLEDASSSTQNTVATTSRGKKRAAAEIGH